VWFHENEVAAAGTFAKCLHGAPAAQFWGVPEGGSTLNRRRQGGLRPTVTSASLGRP
jgi:hypothetical protein